MADDCAARYVVDDLIGTAVACEEDQLPDFTLGHGRHLLDAELLGFPVHHAEQDLVAEVRSIETDVIGAMQE